MLTIHKASAGSGKTYALTYNYIKLLLGYKDEDGQYRLSTSGRNRHRATLAITFTNKATEEMKRRIVHQLACLAGVIHEESPYVEDLCKDLSTTPDKIEASAKRTINELLCDFSNFNVSTIDSFFQIVLRTFAREANITGNYGVELDDKAVLVIAVNEMLATINRATNHELSSRRELMAMTRWLKQFMSEKISAGEQFNVFNRNSSITSDLVRFFERAITETYKFNAVEINAYLDDINHILAFAAQLRTILDDNDRQFFGLAKRVQEENEGRLSKGCRGVIGEWAKGVMRKNPLPKTLKEGLVDPDKLFASKQNPGGEAQRLVMELVAKGLDYYYRHPQLKLLRRQVYVLGLLGEVQRFTSEFRKENNAILLSDTNEILRNIISEAEAPFIYERLGVRLNHFLIDEFQDTSRLQWANLGLLVKESLANGHDNLVIGDEKQSIYRFRNSDPDLIVKVVPEEFKGQSQVCGNNPKANTNWRSSRQVVAFNNSLFTYMSKSLDMDEIYSNVIQEIAHSEMDGYVTASPYQKDGESLNRMVTLIIDEINRGYSFGDIAVLVSGKKDAEKVIAALMDAKRFCPELAKMQILSEDSLMIGSAMSVKIIISALAYLDEMQSADEVVTPSGDTRRHLSVRVIRNRFYYYIAHGHDVSEAVKLTFSDDTTGEELALEAADMKCINLPSIVERIVSRYLSEEMRTGESVYISAFLDVVGDFCEKGNAALHSFLKWWDSYGESKACLSIPSDVDAIRVMTIHKSKGLEFPCVHVPIIEWTFVDDRNMEWFSTRDADGNMIEFFKQFDPETVPPFIPLNLHRSFREGFFANQFDAFAKKATADVLNKTYVAFTRAVKELHVGYYQTKNAGPDNIQGQIRMAFESMTEQWLDSRSTPYERQFMVALNGQADAEGCFIYGTPMNKNAKEVKADAEETFAMPAFCGRDNEKIWDLSRIEELDEYSTPRQVGVTLHAIMNKVGHRDDIERAAMRVAMRGSIGRSELDGYVASLQRALDDERVSPWFDGYERVLNERAYVYYDREDRLHRYRPDRVVWTQSGEIHVVDYKFGDEEPTKYIDQVNRYMAHLRAMYPTAVVRGFLWYPIAGRITEV